MVINEAHRHRESYHDTAIIHYINIIHIVLL